MKLNQVVWLGLTSLIVTTLPLSSLATPERLSSTNQVEAQADPLIALKTVAIAAGRFTTAEQPTAGIARIVEANGHRYLELDNNFRTSHQGADLYVILNESSKRPGSNAELDQAVNLGRLQRYSGAQRYLIADDVDVDDYHSVSIWSQSADIVLGHARLRSENRNESWMPTFSELYWERSDG